MKRLTIPDKVQAMLEANKIEAAKLREGVFAFIEVAINGGCFDELTYFVKQLGKVENAETPNVINELLMIINTKKTSITSVPVVSGLTTSAEIPKPTSKVVESVTTPVVNTIPSPAPKKAGSLGS